MSVIKMIIKVNPHSVVDLITNSSTELFVVNTDKTFEVIRDMINEMQSKYPNEYGNFLHVDTIEEYQLNDIYGIYDIEEAKKYLIANGYAVTPKADFKPYFTISGERGGLAKEVKDFIYDNFEVIHYDFEG